MGRLQRVARHAVAAVTRRLTVDTRALAALRIALGAILLADLASRSTDLVAFYTDSGVVPRSALSAIAPTFGQVSIHAFWGSAWAQAVLFVVAGLAAVAMLVGYRTKLAALVSFVLLISLHARNPAVLGGGDSLLRHLLFWALFVPIGERWSVDATRKQGRRETVTGFATAGLLTQVVLVYATNAILKLRGDIWLSGDAVEQVMLLTRYSTWLGQWLVELPWLLVAAETLWLGLLVCSPLLLVLTGWHRALLVAAFAGMHGGMVLLMELGLFPFVSVAALLPFVPSVVWNRLPSPPVERSVPGVESETGPPVTRPGSLAPVAATALCVMLVVNAASVGYVSLPAGTPDAVESKGWDMFAPYPPGDDGWFVLPGPLESGRQIDALRQASLSWDRPPDVSQTFPNRRWRKLLYQLPTPPETALGRPLAQYLCQRWNHDHADDLQRLRIVYVEYPIPESNRGDRVQLGTFGCDTPA